VHIQNRCRGKRYSDSHETSDLRRFTTVGHRIKEQLQTALRSSEAFVMRRAQIILAREQRRTRLPDSPLSLGCGQQTVHDAIHDFNRRGFWMPW